MNIKKFLFICSALIAAQLLTGCESDDERKLAAAQSCLDHATSADADTCAAMVQDVNTESAYLIRCSANFIAQGFTADRMASAFQKVKDNTGGTDPMVALMGWFVFQNITNNTAADTVTNCTRSGVRSMLRLATAAELATTFASFTGLNNFTSTDPATLTANMQAAITAASGGGNPAEVGAVAITAQAAYCNDGSAYANTEVCTNLNDAISQGTDPTTVGNRLIAALNTNSGH